MKNPIPLLLMALTVAACEAPTPTPRDVGTGEAEGLPPSPAPPTPPGGSVAPAPASLLSAMSRADFEDRLESGFGCNLSRNGGNLLIAVSGDAVAKVDGTVVDLTGAPATLDAMARGGRYSGGGATIQIVLAPDLGEGDAVDETFARPVRVTATSAGRSEVFEAVWNCGS
ncbi:MAG: hypothetical protein M3Q74_05785 [Pseudomonadota bacterium]|nr:hypothetical protein [Pseudomonadota bacterium]